MKYLFCLVLCLCFLWPSQRAAAQNALLKVGGGGGYEYMAHTNWNKAIQAYNALPSTSLQFPKLAHGYRYTFGADYVMTDGVAVGLSYTNSSFKSEPGAELTTPMLIKVGFQGIALDVDLYPLKFFRNRTLPFVRESFFVRLSPSYYLLRSDVQVSPQSPLLEGPVDPLPVTPVNPVPFRTAQSGPTPPPNEPPVVLPSNGFGLRLGAGYHVYVTDRLMLTPMVKMEMGFGHELQGLSAALGSTGESNYDNSTVLRLGAEVKLSYAILQRLPICPLDNCKVQQEHRHPSVDPMVMELKRRNKKVSSENAKGKRPKYESNQAYRGNPYTLRQNQKYGDKHRGDATFKTKKKKHKSQKATEKRVKKRQKRARKLIIVGGEG